MEKRHPSPPWTELPREITWNILRRLGVVEMLENAEKVCTAWRRVCKDPSMWRVIEMLNLDEIPGKRFDLEKICCHLVERSLGQLEDIKLKHIASDELIDYIAGRSKKLRSLQLGSYFYITDAGLIEAVKRLPLLEKLELDVVLAPISSETVEKVGRSCPLLKSFALNINDARYLQNKRNEDAMAISRSMPGLCHLELLGNGLTNEGLEAILDGCPHLESLDLGGCYHVELFGDIGKRVSEQIKWLKYPNDSTLMI